MSINLTKEIAVGDEVFISGVKIPGAVVVVLHRGPTHYSPDGEHCCARIVAAIGGAVGAIVVMILVILFIIFLVVFLR